MTFRFGPFVLDVNARQLTQDGREVRLAPKAFELLAALIVDRPKAISKKDLQQQLWPDTFVVEANLSNLIAEIRDALGDKARSPTYIRTAHGFGYAFSGEVTVLGTRPGIAANLAGCWLEWDGRRFPLAVGENIIGRDPDLNVSLDSSTASRRHARIAVNAQGATLEDLDSKNGTLLGDKRVTAPVRLSDGDTIGIGSLILTFRTRPALGSTETQVKPG